MSYSLLHGLGNNFHGPGSPQTEPNRKIESTFPNSNSGKNFNSHANMGMFAFTVLSLFASFFVCLFHGVEKWSSREYALEYLDSSGTKIMMGGLIVRQLRYTRKPINTKSKDS